MCDHFRVPAKYAGKIPYVFGDVPGRTLNGILRTTVNVSVALNVDNFAQKKSGASGTDRSIDVKKCVK